MSKEEMNPYLKQLMRQEWMDYKSSLEQETERLKKLKEDLMKESEQRRKRIKLNNE